MRLAEIRHPEYTEYLADWYKWRLTYKGGRDFIETYLKAFSRRETTTDFDDRKEMTYCPSFAKAAITEIKNSIFQRMVDIARVGGSENYQASILGLNGGVDRRGSSMNSYIGMTILKELLTMRKVGVYVDMPTIEDNTLFGTKGKKPYLYAYEAEDILSWRYAQPDEFSELLLYDHLYTNDSELELPSGAVDRYRFLKKTPNGVELHFYDEKDQHIDKDGNQSDIIYHLDLPKIPFVLFEIPVSLLEDVADYQVALLNLESADINYARKANFPFYTEQYDARIEAGAYNQPVGSADTTASADAEIKVGPMQGRRYGRDLDRPAFINPSPEPLKVSMEKCRQIKEDIRQLVNLSVENLPKIASAESKEYDDRGLESGLHFIGLTLENGERRIAECWAAYEGSKPALVTYPESYNIRTEDDRQKEAEAKTELLDNVPSDTYRREMTKEIAKLTIGHKVTVETLSKIYKEIDNAPTLTSNVDDIKTDWENGFVSTETASVARGYSKDEVEKAKKDHAERVAATLAAQTAPDGQTAPGGTARGVKDTQIDQPDGVDEKVGKEGRE